MYTVTKSEVVFDSFAVGGYMAQASQLYLVSVFAYMHSLVIFVYLFVFYIVF